MTSFFAVRICGLSCIRIAERIIRDRTEVCKSILSLEQDQFLSSGSMSKCLPFVSIGRFMPLVDSGGL